MINVGKIHLMQVVFAGYSSFRCRYSGSSFRISSPCYASETRAEHAVQSSVQEEVRYFLCNFVNTINLALV